MLKSMLKRILSLVLILSLFLGIGSSVFATNNIDSNSLRKEFESQVSNQLKLANGDEKTELLNEYNKYKALSESDKVKFIEYINDIEFMKEIVKYSNTPSIKIGELDNERKNVRTSIVSDDIIVVDTIEEAPSNLIDQNGLNIRAAAEEREAWYTKTVSFLGIKVMQVKNTLKYNRTGYGGNITKIINSNHRVTRNLTPNKVSYSNKYHSRTNTRATSTMDFTMSFIFKGTWTYGDGESRISVDNKGNVNGHFHGTVF